MTIQEFVNALNIKWPKQFDYFDFVEGKKYWKVVQKRKPDANGYVIGGMSAYAFIDKVSGALYKPASWNAPAKHIRGNINDQTGLDACNEYSVVYLR